MVTPNSSVIEVGSGIEVKFAMLLQVEHNSDVVCIEVRGLNWLIILALPGVTS